MPWTPSLPSSGQRSRGKVLLRSISSARGAMCVAAKLRTLSRSMSAVSPSPKLNPPRPPASMGEGLSENQVLGEYGRAGAVLQSGASQPDCQKSPEMRPALHLLVIALDVLAGVIAHHCGRDQAQHRAGRDIPGDRVGGVVLAKQPGRDQR